MELITQETLRMEAQSRQSEEQVNICIFSLNTLQINSHFFKNMFFYHLCVQIRALSHVEEESELVRQQEKTLKSEITLLRSKLANCETELLQCKNKIR